MVQQKVFQPALREEGTLSQELSFGLRAGSCFKISILPHAFNNFVLKATSHSTIFDIPMRPVREDQKHRRRFTRPQLP